MPRGEFLWLAVAVLAVSTSGPAIVSAAPTGPLWIAAGRVAVTIAALTLTMRGRVPMARALRSRTVLWAGTWLALHFACWIAAVSMTSVARAMFLVALQPVWSAVLGRFIGDRPSWRTWLGSAVAIAGLTVMLSGEAPGGGGVLGDVLALGGGLFAAAYLAVGRHARQEMPLASYFRALNIVAVGWLFAFALIMHGLPGAEPLAVTWPWVVYIGLVPGWVGHGLINRVVRVLPAHLVSLSILLEPVIASGIAWAWLDQELGWRDLVGGAVMLLGIGVGTLGERAEPPSASEPERDPPV